MADQEKKGEDLERKVVKADFGKISDEQRQKQEELQILRTKYQVLDQRLYDARRRVQSGEVTSDLVNNLETISSDFEGIDGFWKEEDGRIPIFDKRIESYLLSGYTNYQISRQYLREAISFSKRNVQALKKRDKKPAYNQLIGKSIDSFNKAICDYFKIIDFNIENNYDNDETIDARLNLLVDPQLKILVVSNVLLQELSSHDSNLINNYFPNLELEDYEKIPRYIQKAKERDPEIDTGKVGKEFKRFFENLRKNTEAYFKK